jgi:hypothetical protein
MKKTMTHPITFRACRTTKSTIVPQLAVCVVAKATRKLIVLGAAEVKAVESIIGTGVINGAPRARAAPVFAAIVSFTLSAIRQIAARRLVITCWAPPARAIGPCVAKPVGAAVAVGHGA